MNEGEQDTLSHIYSLLDEDQVDSIKESEEFVKDKRYRLRATIYTQYIFEIRKNPKRREDLFVFFKEDWPTQVYNTGNPTVRVHVENEIVNLKRCKRLYETLSEDGKVDFWNIVDAVDIYIFG